MQNAMAKPDHAGGGSYDYMRMFGIVSLGYMWARIARAAIDRKAAHPGDGEAMDAKLIAGRFYMQRAMPETAVHLAKMSAGSDIMMSMLESAF